MFYMLHTGSIDSGLLGDTTCNVQLVVVIPIGDELQ